MSHALLKGINLTKWFGIGDGVFAVHNVSLDISPGEFVVIVGPSGCGKTTLLNLLGGLDKPTHGDVVLNGQRYSKLGETGLARLRRRQLGFVFQFFNLLNDLSAAENIALPMRLAGARPAVINARIEELLGTVSMLHRANHSPHELSGGEQQRVAIARALANQPALVLADEPTGNLDTKNSEEIRRLFRKLNVENGQTFVVVSHDAAFADYAHRVVRMTDGVIGDIEVKAT